MAREYHEGPDAARRFESALNHALSVPKAELVKREARWKKARKADKTRRARRSSHP
jgi:hypothetical protein